MRIAVLSALLLVGVVQPALAAPAVSEVKVSIDPGLSQKIDDLGGREFDILTAELRHSIERQIAPRSGGGTLDLIIDDATPNRPTPRQLSNKPGLSFESFGVGGARITGAYVDASGKSTPIAFSWYETDISWARYGSIWHDAETAFDRLADRLAKDQFDDGSKARR